MKKAFPDAVDATASPDGNIVVVLSPTSATVTVVERGTLRLLGAPVALATGRAVMLEWARGSRAERWNDAVSTLPVMPSR